MAVIDTVPGVEVSILINGQPVEEYVDSGEEIDGPLASKTVVKYIEAISDAEFIIKASALSAFYQHRKTKDDILVGVEIDGARVRGCFQRHAKSKKSAPWSKIIEGASGLNGAGRRTISAFKFTAVEIVETTDKAKIEKDTTASAKLGEICVEIFRVKILGRTKPKDKVPKGAASEIAEKAVKGRALSHGTTFGPGKVLSTSIRKKEYLDGNDTPLARFVFRYRSKDALRKLLIIPRSPSPDPFDALSAAERESLAREAFQNRQGPKREPGIKAERTVKRERSNSDAVDLTGAAPKSKQRKTSMEAPIDLTDD
ncbi:hypothetical protein V495_00779 [Pseudogymnoascus sp. VKM F-4514 (FW-929)]|nr:hypothetical protein V495_00779 [Pseudogymnoascus sp. VKM F-4514 (FW-929)]KFY62621.1 hypothetical protein V497_02306 [Pseudogymnoascus sp. VKM F-4516 (FW-969)]